MFQTHDRRVEFKAVAKTVATALFADLKNKTVPTIGIDIIRERLRSETCWRTRAEFDALEEMTTRCVVELVG